MRSNLARGRWLVAALVCGGCAAVGQTTTNTSLNVSGTAGVSGSYVVSGTGQAFILALPGGPATISIAGSQALDANLNPTGPVQAVFTFATNQFDSFQVAVSYIDSPIVVVEFPLTHGTGAYNFATGSLTMTLVQGPAFGSGNLGRNWTMSGEGNIKPGAGIVTTFAFNGSYTTQLTANLTYSLTGTGTLAPLGNVTLNSTIEASYSGDTIPGNGTAVLSLNAADSINAAFTVANLASTLNIFVANVTGGTGAFAGATGSMKLTFSDMTPPAFTLTGAGSVTQPPVIPPPPVITSVRVAGSPAPSIAQNAWIEVKGTNLVPTTTPAGGVFWNSAPEFASGRLPTHLNGISVTVNGKAAYVYWFCSAATTPVCGVDQINVLTPLDATLGPVAIVVTNGVGSSAPLMSNMQTVSPSFLLFSTKGYVVATHSDFSLLGPTSLYPGLSTPASAGETIILYAVGFGLPTTPLVDGSAIQSGSLPVQPVCMIGTFQTGVASALVSPGLYQIALTIPGGVPSGDNKVTCTYGGVSTPNGDLITIR
jgi:uncharacterized protein (TIGR03437 family)